MRPMLTLGMVALGQAVVVVCLALGLFWAAAAAHLLACGLLIALLGTLRTGPWAGPARLLAALLPPLGPFAVIAALAALAAAPLLGRQASDAEAWRATLFPPADADSIGSRMRQLHDQAAAQQGVEHVVSFADVLEHGELPQQERVVALMAREYRPDFAPLLRAALNAPARPLRAQAAAALTLIETRLTSEAQALRFARNGPALARKLDEMANSGLLEESRARALRSEAASLWRARIAAAPEDTEAAAALGRDLLQLDDVAAGRQALERSYATGVVTPGLLGWLAEARFRAGDLEAVAALLHAHRAELEPLLASNSPLAPALRLWLREEAA